MPFLSKDQIDPHLRKKHEDALRERLRQSLLNPGLTAEQRLAIRQQLESIGQPKVYDANSPALPGAISFGDPSSN